MTRAISRESFDELKNYLGVYLQQGRPVLDADWNENQDIAVAAARRLGRDTHGDGSPDTGYSIVPVIMPDLDQLTEVSLSTILDSFLGSWRFSFNFPGDLLDDFEQAAGFTLSSPQGTLRIAHDRPFRGQGFLRLSGHPGTVTIRKTLSGTVDLSASDVATFWYRRNRKTASVLKFFIEDDANGKTVWPISTPSTLPADTWAGGLVSPLDLRFHILNQTLRNAVVNEFSFESLYVAGGTPPFTWTTTGTLPPGTHVGSTPQTDRQIDFQGTPSQAGTFTFTVKATDSANRTATRQLTLVVQAQGPERGRTTPSEGQLQSLSPFETPTGTPANPARVRAYGFEVPQESGTPLIWDFDDLRLGGTARQRAQAANNFVIRGSELSMIPADVGLYTKFAQSFGVADPTTVPFLQSLIELLAGIDQSVPDPVSAARMHVSGLTPLQIADTLYSRQADPNDPPLTPPAGGPGAQARKDTVYLDVWTEPVTYVDDPDIREVALGGPDTTTRSRIRQRVRVAQGGSMPSGDGRGGGTLATEGSYTAQANRLYLVEIDGGGDIGAATFRWSQDNASTIQRVIQPVPPGSTQVVVEDATAFQKGDRILIRKEFGAEEHQVASVVGNVIGLAQATGSQLGALPAAGRVAGFTTFALADRPTVQRWNAFRVPIPADAADPALSAAVPLNDGVVARFGGHGMRPGDYWNFRTRFLAGDDASGLDPLTRIEQLAFQRPRGTVHHYVPLATLTRDPADPEPDLITMIADLRPRAGNTHAVNLRPSDVTVTGSADALLASTRLPSVSPGSKLMVFWSGDVFFHASVIGSLRIKVAYYNDFMTDPIADPETGLVFEDTRSITLSDRQTGVATPFTFVFAGVETVFQSLASQFTPTSAQIIATVTTNTSIDISAMNITVMELKKSTELINDL
ncbi:putative Ig domain-containing protein [Nonomuraea sp. NPDC050153]|uniref:putative Ig domain-containing protein n=1 Tax=Nonomuraea sp. NPDC050153 TaxID=3364359 RepID=UPI00378A2D5C